MALHNVGEAKDEIQALLQGQTLDKVGNLNGALERAARTTLQNADIPEASGIQPITLYGGVYYYTAPPTIFGGALNLIRRQGDASTPWDYNYKVPVDEFTRGKKFVRNGYMVDFEYLNGVGYMGIATPNTFPKLILDPMNAVGTTPNEWVAAGSASGLAQDTTNYFTQPASLRFTLTGSSSGTLTKTFQSSFDASVYDGVGVAFLAIEIPDGATASTLTNISLKLGSSAANYNSVTATQGFLGAWVDGNWLLVAFDFSGASTTGTPDWSVLDYIEVTLNHTATLTNFRVGGLFISLPSPHEILFQSSAIFLASGVLSQAITSDGNDIILNDAAYNLYIHECALTIALQQGGTLENANIQMLRAILYGTGNEIGLYAHYRANNPSGQLRQVGSYYDNDRW